MSFWGNSEESEVLLYEIERIGLQSRGGGWDYMAQRGQFTKQYGPSVFV